MRKSDRVKMLGGPYSAPLVHVGQLVRCEIRGEVEFVRLSSGPIPWPIGRIPPRGRQRFMILCGDLVETVRRESEEAVCHWWGVGTDTVWRWRKALGVEPVTEGTHRIKSKLHAGHLVEAREAARPTLSSPERREKIAASRRGKPRPPEVGQAVGRSRKGTRHTEESRRKMSEGQRKAWAGRVVSAPRWTPEEDELVRTLDPQEASARTGRTLKAIWSRRKKLGVNRVD